MIEALLKHEPLITLETAIDNLNRNEKGKWNHRFISTADSSSCEICQDQMINHSLAIGNASLVQMNNDKIKNPKECQVCYNEIESYEELLVL